VSRNLCRTDCYFCEGAIVLAEPWRAIERSDCGRYLDEYEGMPVAKAECVDCQAKYLAWGWHPNPSWPRGLPFAVCDLSFRSTFNDEPGAEDMPRWEIETVRRRVGPWKGRR
jgi:hypothetical protein